MKAKRLMKWVIVLFLFAVLPGFTAVMAQGQEQGESDSPTTYNLYESEGNNTRASADAMNIGDIMGGKIGTTNDVDYFRFRVSGNAYVAIDIDAEWIGSTLDSAVCLEDSDGRQLVCNGDEEWGSTESYARFVVTSGEYYVRVFGDSFNEGFGPAAFYELKLNDQLLQIGDVKGGTVPFLYYEETCGDDFVYFEVVQKGYVLLDIAVEANPGATWGSVVTPGGTFAADHNELVLLGLEPGVYGISFLGDPSGWPPRMDWCMKYSLAVSSPLLISAAPGNLGTGSVAGVSFQSGDILAHSDLNNGEERWRMLFDASDVGVKTVSNIAAHGGDELLLSVGATQTLPGVGAVTPWDMFVFDPIRYGVNTAGTFRWGLKGSEHGLTTAAEKLDAINGWVNGYDRCYGFPVSTAGTASVTGWIGPMKQDDEDVFCKVYNGAWQPWDWFFDVDGANDAPATEPKAGKVPGLPAEDVFAMAYDDPDNVMFMTIQGTGTIMGHSVTQKDIFAINYPSYTWGGVVWHGPDHGWNYNIDAIEWNGP